MEAPPARPLRFSALSSLRGCPSLLWLCGRNPLVHAFITSRLDYSSVVFVGRIWLMGFSAATKPWQHIALTLTRVYWLSNKSQMDNEVPLFTHKSLHDRPLLPSQLRPKLGWWSWTSEIFPRLTLNCTYSKRTIWPGLLSSEPPLEMLEVMKGAPLSENSLDDWVLEVNTLKGFYFFISFFGGGGSELFLSHSLTSHTNW